MLFIATIAVIKLATYIVRPVEGLLAATSQFAVGKSITPLENNSYEEINRLNHTFTLMTKKLAERERGHKKASLILETTDNGVLAINKQTRKVTMFNRGCEQLFNVPKDFVMGNHVAEVMQTSPEFEKFVISSSIMSFF